MCRRLGDVFCGLGLNINYDHIGGRCTNAVHNGVNILDFHLNERGEVKQDPCMAGQVQTASPYLKLLNF